MVQVQVPRQALKHQASLCEDFDKGPLQPEDRNRPALRRIVDRRDLGFGSNGANPFPSSWQKTQSKQKRMTRRENDEKKGEREKEREMGVGAGAISNLLLAPP